MDEHRGGRVFRMSLVERPSIVRRDAAVAVRAIRRAPTFAFATIAILGLGIGMSTAMFAIYTTALADRLPVTAQDQLVVMHPLDRGGAHLDAPYPYLREIARDSAIFRGATGVYHLGARPSPFMDGSTPIVLDAVNAAPDFFDVLGVRPAVGRTFVAEDGKAGAPPVIVSYATWRRRFGGDAAVIGHSVVVPYTRQAARIIGVAPAGFEYPAGTDAWIPVLRRERDARDCRRSARVGHRRDSAAIRACSGAVTAAAC
jgi:putative ABC transport system permease protein